ncbi:bifunctional phosphopantothenoylcysteine decarboxylase/phosphopantothenate--cysteine ligase CoaBC [Dietzia sp.]|uniref:bifunctional phosphopantothenoylcysteine decarboxylase/phosphopantothenate--cysteine ligase CoaBC n=1 Tax=Dietzia sp. TaxID=1871616 RepID=UPI002FD999AF
MVAQPGWEGGTTRRIVIGVGGGIAAYKSCQLVRYFRELGHHVVVIPTESALNFVGKATFEALSGNPVATDVFSDVPSVRHVNLGKNADLVVVAPATADLLARMAQGRADDLLTTTLLTARCPVLLAPAMHTEMWQHPATVRNVTTLRGDGLVVMPPAEGRLTGSDSGAGRLPEADEIGRLGELLLADPDSLPQDLVGLKVLVTAGGTREELDPVRFLGNRSSGKQGQALAAVAAARGARVTLVSAATKIPNPAAVETVHVDSAREMGQVLLDRAPGFDVVIKAAAVADFRPEKVSESKMKKGSDSEPEAIRLVRNPDLLAGLVEARRNGGIPEATTLVGFAAETGDAHGSVLDHGRAKLRRKGCDLLVVNKVGRTEAFGTDTNSGWILRRTGGETAVPVSGKYAVASRILDAVVLLREEDGNGREPAEATTSGAQWPAEATTSGAQ